MTSGDYTETEPAAQNTVPEAPKRKKYKKRRPKWQRVLRRYWPLIRLILCLILVIVVVVISVKSCGTGSDGNQNAEESKAQTEQQTAEKDSGIDRDEAMDAADKLAQSGDYAGAVTELTAVTDYDEDDEITGQLGEYAAALIKKADPLANVQSFIDTLAPLQGVECVEDEYRAEILKKVRMVAGGYDYTGAIDILKTVKGWESDDELLSMIDEYTEADSKLITYSSMSSITHVFFHSLVVDPSRAFDNDSRSDGYNLYMTTVKEFRAILESMYERGYVLVSPHQVAGEVDQGDGTTKFEYLEIRLPAGKTPFMMSEDDVSYYGDYICGVTGMDETPRFPTKDGDGIAYKLLIGEDGYITCAYMDAEGNTLYGEYDLVPILEGFIQEHPDFAYHGARAIIATTGYEGAFGYRIKPSYEPYFTENFGEGSYEKECEECAAVANAMREQGWDLASHSYGHPRLGISDVEKTITDTEKFQERVEFCIGEVDILIYPHGDDIAGTEMYDDENEKFTVLWNAGFRYFFNVDNCVAWHQMGDHYFRGNRRNLDGYRMYWHAESMRDLFDVEDVFDSARPVPVPKI